MCSHPAVLRAPRAVPSTNASSVWGPIASPPCVSSRCSSRGSRIPACRAEPSEPLAPGKHLLTTPVLTVSDVDECAGQSHGCGQLCINTAGSYRCACQDGFGLAADNKACQPLVSLPEPETFSQAGNLSPPLQDSSGCSGPSMKVGINTQRHRVAGAGVARDRRGDDSQTPPSALFSVTPESLYHPNNLPCAQIQRLLPLQG